MNVSFVVRLKCFVKSYYLCFCMFVEKINLVKFCNPLASKIFQRGGGGGGGGG